MNELQLPAGTMFICEATEIDRERNPERRVLVRRPDRTLFWQLSDFSEESIAGAVCTTCHRWFKNQSDAGKHATDKHNPNRRLLASERPTYRGTIPCGIEQCQHTFNNESAARQHRRDKHGLE